MSRVMQVVTSIHGRVLIQEPEVPAAGTIVICHGYAQNADDALADLDGTPGLERWTIVAIQGLHRFYARGGQKPGGDKVVASWMTRQDRELAVEDNIAYVDRALDAVLDTVGHPRGPQPAARSLIFCGFSQGASMAYRAAMLGGHTPSAIVALAGDIPPEVKARQLHTWPPVLIGVGDQEHWYTAPRVDEDLGFLRASGVDVTVVRFTGKHEWTQEFRHALGAFLTVPLG